MTTDLHCVDDHCNECGEFEAECLCLDPPPEPSPTRTTKISRTTLLGVERSYPCDCAWDPSHDPCPYCI